MHQLQEMISAQLHSDTTLGSYLEESAVVSALGVALALQHPSELRGAARCCAVLCCAVLCCAVLCMTC